MAIPPPGPGAPTIIPGGYGYANLNVNAAGLATMSGRLADGTPFSESAPVGSQIHVPVYVGLYGTAAATKGLLEGWLSTNGSGSLTWVAPAGAPPSKAYAAGFTNASIALDYSAFSHVAGRSPITTTNLTMTIGNAGLGESALAFNVILTSANFFRKVGEMPTNFVGVATPVLNASGVFSETFEATGAKAVSGAHGIVLQYADEIEGYWLAPDGTSCPVLVQP